jgi:hypothetical protein
MTTRITGWLVAVLLVMAASPLWADHTPTPSGVAIAGSLQSEVGCPGDWQPECAATDLGFDAEDTVWQATFALPAGNWEYKAALNDSWDENYGQNATQDGANIPLSLATPQAVKFYYHHATHWVTDNRSTTIATAPGSFQSELGCAGDWDPGCLRSWLKDPDGDGIHALVVLLPAGNYEAKVAINESWDENYGAGGVPNGPNIPFSSDGASCTQFRFSAATKLATIDQVRCETESVTIAGSLQTELGCSGDWDPSCVESRLVYDANDDVWQRSFDVPAGSWEYKAAVNGSWDENYGTNAQRDGANIPLTLAAGTTVKFYYDDKTHWITDRIGSLIATAPGSFQSELGCSGDWDPGCLRSWLQDADGDGVFSFTALLPAGSYETKVAIDEGWDENYGQGGVPNGPNIPFASDGVTCKQFSFSGSTKVLSIQSAACDSQSVEQSLQALLVNVTGVGPGKSLANKVKLAQTYYAVPDLVAACATLTGFVNEVAAQAGKKIAPVKAASFTADAEAVMELMGCE